MKNSGFTLVELMIVIVVISVLAIIAIPAYTDYVTRSKRADAKAGLLSYQLEQEKYRANNPTYAAAASLGLPSDSPDHHYIISVSGAVSATSYQLTAAPKASQNDPVCATLTIDHLSNKSATGTTATPEETCWQR